eukprot:TRINITY_DN6730_c1_g1_i2.p3 TRINITY_DN6730_c1_g1~~TRINITY_DN6730_c1_g1_i2.p3  ORF type:complete len:172 (+),score=1.38 TRINITY_DN6730_c1_g1_i2:68-583(+)
MLQFAVEVEHLTIYVKQDVQDLRKMTVQQESAKIRAFVQGDMILFVAEVRSMATLVQRNVPTKTSKNASKGHVRRVAVVLKSWKRFVVRACYTTINVKQSALGLGRMVANTARVYHVRAQEYTVLYAAEVVESTLTNVMQNVRGRISRHAKKANVKTLSRCIFERQFGRCE